MGKLDLRRQAGHGELRRIHGSSTLESWFEDRLIMSHCENYFKIPSQRISFTPS